MRIRWVVVALIGSISCSDSPTAPSDTARISIESVVFRAADCPCLEILADGDGALPLSADVRHIVTIQVHNPRVAGRSIRWTVRGTWPDLARPEPRSPSSPAPPTSIESPERFDFAGSTLSQTLIFWSPAPEAADPRLTIDVDETGSDLASPTHLSVEFRIRSS